MIPADEILPISNREDTLILGDVLLLIAYKGNTVMSPVTVNITIGWKKRERHNRKIWNNREDDQIYSSKERLSNSR
jgi:hypothetical protein